jgi:gamma-glutamyltranspeptidase / glutathione hydrolase
VVVINGQGPAPKAAHPGLFAGEKAPPGNGPLGATVPAVVDAAALALIATARSRSSEVLAPAIALADGFPMYDYLARYLQSERRASEPYEWTMRTYYPDGRVTQPGEMFRQPNLAATLRALAAAERAARERGDSREEAIRAGRDAFYHGPIARAHDRRRAGRGRRDDRRGPRVVPRAHRGARDGLYRGYTVHKAGFWNQGPALLQALQILEGFDLAAMGHGSPDAVHTVVEAIKLAFADRDRYYGDPDFADVPAAALLSPAYAAARRSLIDPRRRASSRVPAIRPGARHGRVTPCRDAGRTGRPLNMATRRPSRSSIARATCSRPRRAPGGCSAAPSSPATRACR